VSKLAQLLDYLDRGDVRSIIFRSGNPVALQTHTRIVAVTAAPLSEPHIHRFFANTELAGRFPQYDEDEVTHETQIFGRKVLVSIAQVAGILEVRIELAPAERVRPPGSAPLRPTRDVPARGGGPPSDSVPTITSVSAQSLPARTVASRSASGSLSTPSEPTPETNGFNVVDSDQATRGRNQLEHLLRSVPHATDIHLVADAVPRVRHAMLLEPRGSVLSTRDIEGMVVPLLERRHQEQLNTSGYCDLAIDLGATGRFRVNLCRQRSGLKACFRRVVHTPPSVADLGLPSEVEKLQVQHQGLVVISGPSGHGKTTTLAALVDLFNASRSMHIITVEDPVEVLHPRKQALVSQREVGSHTKSFHAALAASLREDPDVIVIGELRDRETVEMALSASETGHLVLSTMSTPSAAKTIDRLIALFPPDDQSQVRATLAGALKLVLSQRLLRRADGQGLVAAFEMVTGHIPLWTLIRDNKLYQLPSLLQRGRAYGMIRLEDSLRTLIAQGLILEEEALHYTSEPNALQPRDKAPSGPAPAAKATLGIRRGS